MKASRFLAIGLVLALAAAGCSSSDDNSDGGTSGSSGSTASTGSGPKVDVTFSGETLGVDGLPFTPSADEDADPYFVDGWSMHYDEILYSFGNVRLSPGATQNADQSVVAAPVAQKVGPFIVDMHKPVGLTGKDGDEPAQLVFTFDKQDDGTAFDTSARYAFSYDSVPATASATKVNLDASQDADVALMVQKGWTKLYKGTVTYDGTGSYSDATIQQKFAAFPTTIHFAFGFSDAAQNLNCQNPDFGEDNTPANRGIQPTASGTVIAQITLHVDHLFWDVLKQEGAPLRFDPIAAWATDGQTLQLSDLSSKPLAATFADGTPLPDRGPIVSSAAGVQSDQADPTQVLLNTNGVTTVHDLAQFIVFAAQSQMHLDADGLCYIRGQNASDPFFQPQVN